MALNKATIAAELVQMFTKMMASRADQPEALLEAANAMADVLINAIKSASVVYTTGLVAPSTGGPVTGLFTHTIE